MRYLKYNFDTEQKIIQLKKSGMASRAIAEELGVSKSGVNDAYLRLIDEVQEKEPKRSTGGAKVLFFDVETSAAQVFCFGRHKQFINQDAVKIEGGKLLCSGYRWEGEEQAHVLFNYEEVKAGEDYSVCKAMWELFSQADAVVAHNLKNFDLKMLEARCLANGLPSLPTVKLIDTLEIAKNKFRFPSNKLDSLASYFGLGRKVSHSGISLWVQVQEGSRKALDEMVEYCEQDVNLLHDLFQVLRSRGLVNGYNAALYYDDDVTRCKACGSDHLELTGRAVTTGLSSFEEIKCNSCGTLQRTRKNTLSKEKRSKLLA
jgi:uncharacterized protein YprB with RNaseH-like and TPR domain